MNLVMISGDRSLVAGEQGPLHDMLTGYRRHWDHIDVLCPPSAEARELRPFENVHLHPSDRGRWGHPDFVLRTVGKVAREREVQLLVSHDYGWFRNGVGALRAHRRLGVPWISEIHHVDGFPHRDLGSREGLELALRYRLTRHFVRRFAKHACGFRVVCDQVAALLGDWGVPQERIHRLGSLYLDFEHLYPPEGDERTVDVLFCGRLEREKGVDLLLATIDRLIERMPALEVTIVGRGRARRALKKALRAWNKPSIRHVERHLSPTELADLYRRSRVLLCPSWSEGNPRVVAEAMACGVVVVSTPVGRVPELVQDGVNGRVVPWDAEGLARATADVLESPERSCAMAAAAPSAVAGFGKQKVLADLARRYQSVAAKAKSCAC